MELQEYWEAIRTKVCSNCINSDGYANCRLDPTMQCALQPYLALIVKAVNRVRSDRLDDYVSEVRAIVCAQCKYQSLTGKCLLRTELDCALDRYFPLVVEAIEELNTQTKPAA